MPLHAKRIVMVPLQSPDQYVVTIPDYDKQWADLFILEIPERQHIANGLTEEDQLAPMQSVIYVPPVSKAEVWRQRHPAGLLDDSHPENAEEEPEERPQNYTIMLEPTDYHKILSMYRELSDVSAEAQYVESKFHI